MKSISVLGIDLAKNIFQLHGVDEAGKITLQQKVRRAKLREVVALFPPCLIAMEACGGANYWAREFEKLGHQVRIISPQFVKPFVKSNKNDAADAEAIVEAALRPNMRFVPIKQVWQQEIQSVHRVRELFVKQRTAIVNCIHGQLAEYGVALSTFSKARLKQIAEQLDGECDTLPNFAKQSVRILVERWKTIDTAIDECNRNIEVITKTNPICSRLTTIPGVGPMTATASIAFMGDANRFRSGRQFAACLGLVPRQNSTGGKTVLLGISKRGDGYLRRLLIHGSRAVLNYAKEKPDRLSQWVIEKEKTRGKNRATVALANKNARIIWALAKTQQTYRAA